MVKLGLDWIVVKSLVDSTRNSDSANETSLVSF